MKKFISVAICSLIITSCSLFDNTTEPSTSAGSSSSSATQCLGTTQQNKRCKNKTTNSNGYCYLHQPSKISN